MPLPISALQDHLQMNLESPTSASKTLHFVWDFVQRTRHNLSFVSAQDLAANKRAALEPYNDSRGRAMFSAMIIRDRTGQTCRKMGMEPVDFGDAVREKAAALESET